MMEKPATDVAGATAQAMHRVRVRMDYGRSYLMAVCDERGVVSSCIADEALKGEPHYAPWLAEYRALSQMRDRCLISHAQASAAEAARRRGEPTGDYITVTPSPEMRTAVLRAAGLAAS